LNPQVFLADPALAPWVVLLVCGIVFAETALLVGFFLPGDSMLFTAGLLVATDTIKFNIWALSGLIIVAAILGNQTGYLIGSKAGPAIFNRPDSRLFKRENVESAHAFFEKHGGKALILARFVPIIRTFVPVIVGVAQMDKRKFFLFNVIGAVLWGGGVTLLGYLLGDRVPWVSDNLDLIFIVIVLISVIPVIIEVGRGFVAKRKAAAVGTDPVEEFIEEHEPEKHGEH
jgi:membrane-associated protein